MLYVKRAPSGRPLTNAVLFAVSELDSTLYFAGAEAASADPKLDGLAVYGGFYRLKVGLPHFLRSDMRMADLHSNSSTFTANIAFK